MKGLLIAFSAIVALTHAAPAPQVEFSAREYQAFQTALGDRIPVAIQSAIRVLAGEEANPTDFVVLNFNGLSETSARTGAAPAAETAPAAATGGIAIARTGSLPTSDDVAELFSDVAEDAVEDVQDAAEDAADADPAEEADQGEAVNRTGLAAEAEDEDTVAEVVNEVTVEQIVAAIESARRKRQDESSQARDLGFALSGLGLTLVRRN